MDLKGKHVLVVGGTKRVGAVLAQRFTEAGARVSATARQSKITHLALDLTQPETFDSFFAKLAEQAGAVDVLVSCASRFVRAHADDTLLDHWREAMTVNLEGPFFLSQSWRKHSKHTPGVLLFIGDAFASHHMPHYFAYAISKRALYGMTQQLARAWAPLVRVGLLHPGPILPEHHSDPELSRRLAERTLLKRWGTPEDLALAALWFCASDYVTGQEIFLDGGLGL